MLKQTEFRTQFLRYISNEHYVIQLIIFYLKIYYSILYTSIIFAHLRSTFPSNLQINIDIFGLIPWDIIYLYLLCINFPAKRINIYPVHPSFICLFIPYIVHLLSVQCHNSNMSCCPIVTMFLIFSILNVLPSEFQTKFIFYVRKCHPLCYTTVQTVCQFFRNIFVHFTNNIASVWVSISSRK